MDLPEQERAEEGRPAQERPAQERIDAISEALARLIARQNQIDARLERIESAIGLAAITEKPPLPASPPPLPPPLPAPPPFFENPPAPFLENPLPEPAIETRFGLGWLNRVAAITLLFGVAFLFKYAVDNQWIGPSMRVALGLVAAALALSAGEWVSLRGQKVFAQGLTGLGLALLYLSFYAGFGFYHLLPQGAAFLLMCLTTVAAGALAAHYDSQAVAILGMVGGYVTPALLATGEDRLGTLAVFSMVLGAGAVGLARVRRWPALEYLAFAGTWLLFLGWSGTFLNDDTRARAFGWLTAVFVLFFVASALTTRLWLLALNAGFYFAGAYFILEPQYHAQLGEFAAALAILHGVIAWVSREKDARFAQLAAAIAAIFLTLQFTSFRITMLWSLEAAALAWLAERLGRPSFQVAAWFLFAGVFLRLFAIDARIFESAFFNARLLTFVVAAAGLWIASRAARSEESRSVTYGAGHLALLWALALEVSAWAQRTAEPQDVASLSATGISLLIAVYGTALVVAGVAARSAMNRILGLGLLALVIAKLYLFDVWQLSRGFRITAFLALGGLLLLVSYLYSRFKPALEKLWKAPPAAENLPL
jgi:uncharacterized membrane protein